MTQRVTISLDPMTPEEAKLLVQAFFLETPQGYRPLKMKVQGSEEQIIEAAVNMKSLRQKIFNSVLKPLALVEDEQ